MDCSENAATPGGLEAQAAVLIRENLALKQRSAQLQGDIVELSAEVARLRGALDRTGGRRVHAPNSPGGA